jgi:hypothetical protein
MGLFKDLRDDYRDAKARQGGVQRHCRRDGLFSGLVNGDQSCPHCGTAAPTLEDYQDGWDAPGPNG